MKTLMMLAALAAVGVVACSSTSASNACEALCDKAASCFSLPNSECGPQCAQQDAGVSCRDLSGYTTCINGVSCSDVEGGGSGSQACFTNNCLGTDAG
jgi:hypothetical protein